MRLKFYEKEQKEFGEAYHKKISGDEIRIVFKKLTRHYRINTRLEFGSRWNGHYQGWCIKIPYNTCFGLLCHELAHAYQNQKYNVKGHNKQLMRIIRRFVNYCKKRNYWQDELQKRTEIKIKPEPTQEELKLIGINKIKSDLIRYDKKLKYYNKLYSNKIKKAKRRLISLEVQLQKLTHLLALTRANKEAI